MAGARSARQELGAILRKDDWRDHLEKIAAGGMKNIGPLFSFLPREPELMHRAAKALGLAVAKLHEKEPEAARNIIRRFMWHMNEESGNIGWGIPAAFAETLAASPALAKDYGRILNSYIMDLGFDDNFCDHDILRRDCYWAIGRLAQERPELVREAAPWLIKGLRDPDGPCRGMAAWALGQLGPDLMAAPALRELAESGANDECEIYENGALRAESAANLAKEALAKGRIR